ncbi:hypothetical protein [Halorussus sp. GCM10023401]|uniref:hypothetical protein n=1 Tax=Halorussus sp. GCM10023401 TaxID=3252680 RepID=UPI003609F240
MISTSGLVDYPTTGDTIRCWVRATGGADDTNFTYGVQDHDNRYLVRIDFVNDKFELWRHEGGQSYVLDSQSSGFSLAEDAWYGIEIEWQDDGTHTGILFDEGQSTLAQVSATDSTWTEGGIGFDAYLGSGGTVYYDYLTTWQFVGDVVDDFEDGNLSEYSFDRGSSGASVVSSPTYVGENALEISNSNTEMISTSGLDHYPGAGDQFGCWIRATGGADDTNFTYGVQDHDNRYLVRIDFVNDEFELWRHEGGQSYVLNSQSSGFSLAEDTWYKVKVNWKPDGTQYAELFKESGKLLAEASATDSTWSSGGVGYDAYLGSSGGSVYFDYFTIDGSAIHACDNNDVIDSFEDGNLSEYSFDRGSSGASIVQEPTCGKSKVLEVSGTDTEMISTSGLDYYPVAGERFSYWVRGANGADMVNLSYGVQDHDNRYFVRVNFEQGHLGLWRYESASGTELADKGVSLTEDAWYEVEVMWGANGHHNVSLRDVHGKSIAKLTATDLTWSDGGIGYDAYLADGGTAYFDHVTFNGNYSWGGHHIIDSFDDGDLLEYNFDRGKSGASVVSNPTKNGSNALAIDNTNTEMVSVPSLDLYPEVGDTFTSWVRMTGGADDMNLTYGVQDHQNRYFVRVDVPNNDLILFRYEGGTASKLASADPTLAEDTWYEVEVEWSEDNVHTVTIRDDGGTALAQISATDSTWTEGGVGYDAYLGSGGTVYVDDVRIKGAGVIDSFEDGDLLKYNFDRGKSGASVVSSPTKDGSKALALSGTNTEMVSVPGLDYHPSAGTTFTSWVRMTGGADDMNLSYGVQDHQNRYFVRVDVPNNDLILFRYEGGTAYKLASADPALAEDTWYEVEVYWANDGTHRVTIYDGTSTPLTQIAATDSTWTEGGVGYDAYLGSSGGTVYVDHVTFGEAGNLPNDATVTGKAAGVNYELEATGDVAPGIEADSAENTSNGTATGSVDDGEVDTFRFSGDISRVAVTNYLEFVADYSTNTITVNDLRSSPSTAAEYEFSIQGDISSDSSAESGDTLDGGTASGSVTGDKDEFSFTGDVEKVTFVGKISVGFQIEYTRQVDQPHPGRTVRDIANHFAEDPNRSRVAFVSTTLGDGNGLYLATGATSADDVPDEIIRLYGPTTVGAFDLTWSEADRLEYWRDGGTDSQMLKPSNVNERPVRRENSLQPTGN